MNNLREKKQRWSVYRQANPNECWVHNKPIADKLMAARVKRGMRPSELAAKAGLDSWSVVSLEMGRATTATPEVADKLGKALGVDPKEFLGETDRRENFLKHGGEMTLLGEVEGTVQEAMAYGHDNCDIGGGSICAIPVGKELPDLEFWRKSNLVSRFGQRDQETSRQSQSRSLQAFWDNQRGRRGLGKSEGSKASAKERRDRDANQT